MKVRCRQTRETPDDLWVGDFSYGPHVMVNGVVKPTYLSLFIDCYSRYVVEGRYYLRQSLDILTDSLLRAWTIHGVSNDLYVDNGKVYHANALKTACYALHINLIHRKKGDLSPGGLVERLFGTNLEQSETEVRAGDILPLQKLNRAFSAWLHTAYHEEKHSEISEKPIIRFQQGKKNMRRIDMDAAIKFFMKTESRTVHKDFSDVTLNRRFYKVCRKLRGDKVLVRYDPFQIIIEKVFIYNASEEYLGEGILHYREKCDSQEPETHVSKP